MTVSKRVFPLVTVVAPGRGVARTSLMLGHSMHTTFVRNSAQSAEAFRRSGTCSVSVRGERMRLEFCGYT